MRNHFTKKQLSKRRSTGRYAEPIKDAIVYHDSRKTGEKGNLSQTRETEIIFSEEKRNKS